MGRRIGWLCLVGCLASLMFAGAALACGSGTITVDKYWIVDKDQGTPCPTGSGNADTGRAVRFLCEASCNCGQQNISYEWHFGDGVNQTVSTTTVDHTYGGNSGTRTVYAIVKCTCGASVQKENLTVYAISGLSIVTAGSENRLCFNTHVGASARALPWNTGSEEPDKLIDWSILVTVPSIEVTNSSTATLTLQAGNWPAANNLWGEGKTLYCTINESTMFGGTQKDELVTGTAGHFSTTRTVEAFYNGNDDAFENPSDDPNWYYYYTNALDNGSHTYDASLVDAGITSWATGAIRIGPTANDDSYIKNFANIVQHEQYHHLEVLHNHEYHGDDGHVAPPYDEDLDDAGNPKPDSVCSGGCQTGGWEPRTPPQPTDPLKFATYGIWDIEYKAIGHQTNEEHRDLDWAHGGIRWPKCQGE